MTHQELREAKQAAVHTLRGRLEAQAGRLKDIDMRLYAYLESLAYESGPAHAGDPDTTDRHNLYEALGGLKFLRLTEAYPFRPRRVRHALTLYEGRWEDDGRTYVEGSGGFRFSGLQGHTHYRLQPFQVFVLAWAYGLHRWEDTGREASPGFPTPLAPTERFAPDGSRRIEDLRWLATDVVLYLPRKSGKTLLASFFGAETFFFGDANAEVYCAANSQEQSKILYGMIRQLIHQLDPRGQRIRQTATECAWRMGQPRQARVAAMSAGGKKKDGLFPQLGLFDEFGSAEYVKDHCDMLDLANVIQSGMGPRREPRTVTTTTAGYATSGPFAQKLEGMRATLMDELKLIPGDRHAADFQLPLILQPDPWEADDEEQLLSSPAVWRKVNPMIGVSVQAGFYAAQSQKARLDPAERREFLTKLTNVYASNRTKDWIKPDEVRALQVDRRIDQCTAADGWVVFVGMDFSKGDDLHAVTYLAVRSDRRGGLEMFADLDAWVTEDAMARSSIGALLGDWAEAGWLRTSPGKVLQTSLPVDRIIRLIQGGVRFARFGYDSYQSHDPINALKAYLHTQMGVAPDAYVVPVSQTYASYNPAVLRIEYAIQSQPPLIQFSPSPLWPWEFGNCRIDEDLRMNNRKMIKASAADSCKVDNVQCLATAFILMDQFEGTRQAASE